MYPFSSVVKMGNLNGHALAGLNRYNAVVNQLIALLVLPKAVFHAVCLLSCFLIIKSTRCRFTIEILRLFVQ